jgi:hypothetical protein
MFTDEVGEIIFKLNKIGFSYRELGRILGCSHMAVYYWAKGKRKPRFPNKVLHVLHKLYEDNFSPNNISNCEYSLNHNGPPNNHFSIKPGDSSKQKYFKRKVIYIANLLDTYNKELIETATLIGLEFLKVSKVSNGDMESFVLALFKVAMNQLGIRLPRWENAFLLLYRIKKLCVQIYLDYLKELSAFIEEKQLVATIYPVIFEEKRNLWRDNHLVLE